MTAPSPLDAARQAEFARRVALAPLAGRLPALVPAASRPQPLHVCYLVPRTDVGGGARVIFDHATHLTGLGATVTLVSHFPPPDWYPLPSRFLRVPFGRELAEGLPPCDVVVAGYWDQILAARLRGVAPVVHFEQGDAHLFEELEPAFEQVVRAHLRAADATVTVSRRVAEVLAGRYAVAAEVVHNAVDPAVFHPPTAGPPPGGTGYLLLVGWDGHAFKGIAEAREMYRRLHAEDPDLDLVWVTPRPPRDPFGTVVVAPDQARLADLYRGAQVYVCASRYESFPLPPLEAMACGAPVVSTRNTGVLEYAVDGHNALLADVGDVAGLASAVRRFRTDPDLVATCRAGGLVTAAGFRWPTLLRPLRDRYDALARRTPGPAAGGPWRFPRGEPDFVDPADAAEWPARLAGTPAGEVALPVRYPAFDGHEVVRWEVVARRAGGSAGRLHAWLPARGHGRFRPPAAPRAYDDFLAGRPGAAAVGFQLAWRQARVAADRAVLGRWLVLALVESGREEEALAVAGHLVQAYPDHTDGHYLAAVVATLLDRPVDLAETAATVALLGEAAQYPEWFHDPLRLLTERVGWPPADPRPSVGAAAAG